MRARIEKNLTLFELIVGIVIFTLLCQIGMLFTPDIFYYSLGLLIGAIMAVAMACHMNYSINRALELVGGDASAIVRKDMAIRYAVIIVVLVILMVLNFASPLTAFLGIMGLKFGAYVQPFTHKLVSLKMLGFTDPVYEECDENASDGVNDASVDDSAKQENV